VKEVQPAARRPMARISFAFIYPDRRGKNVMRQVGSTRRLCGRFCKAAGAAGDGGV